MTHLGADFMTQMGRLLSAWAQFQSALWDALMVMPWVLK